MSKTPIRLPTSGAHERLMAEQQSVLPRPDEPPPPEEEDDALDVEYVEPTEEEDDALNVYRGDATWPLNSMRDAVGAADADADVANAAEVTMKQTLAAFLLDELKSLPKPWEQLSEAQQADVLSRMEAQLTAVISTTVYILAARDWPTVRVCVEKVEFGANGSKVTAKTSGTGAGIHELADHVGDDVLVVCASAEEFVGGPMPEPDADQLDLLEAPVTSVGEGEEPDEMVDARADR